MTIELETLRKWVGEVFQGKHTFYEVSNRFTAEELIDTFKRVRAKTARALSDLSDSDVAVSLAEGSWSISEMITHLVHTQENYEAALFNFATASFAPSLVIAREFGSGAQSNLSAKALQRLLEDATDRANNVFERTLFFYDPLKIIDHPAYGQSNYNSWLFYLLMHEADHGMQAYTLMQQLQQRRQAKRD